MTLEQKIEELKIKSEQNRAMAKEKEICELSGKVSKYIHSVVEFNKIAEDCDQLASWLTELQEHREADKWVPVSKRMPNTLGVYNVTRKIIEGETSYVISDACYFDGQNTWHADTGVNHGRPYITDVIAWKPKPEPYESEGE